jgi:hypothetical protein
MPPCLWLANCRAKLPGFDYLRRGEKSNFKSGGEMGLGPVYFTSSK